MAKPYWTIRFYNPGDYFKTAGWAGNFRKFGDRQLDNVTVFSGLYGLDNYLVWEIHDDLPHYDFRTVELDFRIFIHGSPKLPFWNEQYKVVDVKYVPNKSKYYLYAISSDSALLRTKLHEYEDISSLSFEENRLGYEVLQEILMGNKILGVIYQPHLLKKLVEFEYKYFPINLDWSIYELIRYICDENGYEWYVKQHNLYLSKELKIIKEKNYTRLQDQKTEFSGETPFFRKVYGNFRPMDIMSHISEKWRCVWAKHWVGRTGGLSAGAFSKKGAGRVDERLYFDSLEGRLEQKQAAFLLNSRLNKFSVSIGNILQDDGSDAYVDKVSIQKDFDKYKVNQPESIKINTRIDRHISKNIIEKAARSTPYLEPRGGLLLPSPTVSDVMDGANSVLFKVDGKEESVVVGPYVFGNGRPEFEALMPTKADKKDFKFILPNGWCMYVDGTTGETIIQQILFPHKGKATPTGTYIHIDATGNITLNTQIGSSIKLGMNALLGIARMTDTVTIQSAALITFLTGLNPGNLAANAAAFLASVSAGGHTGVITSASTKSKSE